MRLLPLVGAGGRPRSPADLSRAVLAGLTLLAVPLLLPQTDRAAEQPAPAAKAGRLFLTHNSTFTTLPPDGGKPGRLPAFHTHDDYYLQPHQSRVSPDGKALAFGRAVIQGNGVHPPSQVLVRSLANSDPAEVLVDLPGTELHGWCWSPDGARLAVVSWDAKDSTRNWVVDRKAKEVQELKLPRVKTGSPERPEAQVAVVDWSPDGKRFLAAGGGRLYVVNVDGSGLQALTDPELRVHFYARWAPDGRQALFVTGNQNHSECLYAVSLEGGKARPLVDAQNFRRMRGCWSPDGRRVAYSASLFDPDNNQPQQTEDFLNLIDADGRNTVTVLTEKHPHENAMTITLTDWR